jgi:hypothetical protein
VSRIHEQLGLGYDPDPTATSEPLGKLRIPIESAVLTARVLRGESSENWTRRGIVRTRADVARAHLHWYRQHPDVVAAAVEEHRDRLRAFRLMEGDPGVRAAGLAAGVERGPGAGQPSTAQ